MRALAVGILLCVIGCGGAGDGAVDGPPTVLPPPSPLIGSWETPIGSCAAAYTFTTAGSYERDLACPLDTGAVGLDAEIGTFIESTGRIDFSAAKATCTGVTKAYYINYSVAGGRLSLVFSDGVEVLAPFTPSGTGISTFGCWTMGTFTAAPLMPVP